MNGELRIGVSGWTYAPWRGNFFPKQLPQRGELHFASHVFRSIEINGTFYGLQTPKAFGEWRDQTPDDFIFAVKGSRFITHLLRLRDPLAPLANFFASGVLRLGPKLGPVLWQFPPNFQFDPELLGTFLDLLPHSAEDAIDLARQHDRRQKHDPWLDASGVKRIRHAVEIRHDSFHDPRFTRLLRQCNVALVCADTVKWPRLMDLTADFVYCRLHGSQELYRSGYDDAALNRWAARARCWLGGKPMHDGEFIDHTPPPRLTRDVFIYFDNTDKLHAPEDAKSLIAKLHSTTRNDRNEVK